MKIKDYISHMVVRVYRLLGSSSELHFPKTPHKDNNLCLVAYALGWKNGLEAASKSLREQSPETPFYLNRRSVLAELHALSRAPWPEYQEYGWVSQPTTDDKTGKEG